MSDRSATDSRPTVRRRLTVKPLSVQAAASRHNLHPRSVLRELDKLVKEEVGSGRGFDIDLADVGVRVRRSEEASRSTYEVYDAHRLAQWFLSGESLTLSPKDVETVVSLLDRLAEAIELRRNGRAFRDEGDLVHRARAIGKALSREP